MKKKYAAKEILNKINKSLDRYRRDFEVDKAREQDKLSYKKSIVFKFKGYTAYYLSYYMLLDEQVFNYLLTHPKRKKQNEISNRLVNTGNAMNDPRLRKLLEENISDRGVEKLYKEVQTCCGTDEISISELLYGALKIYGENDQEILTTYDCFYFTTNRFDCEVKQFKFGLRQKDKSAYVHGFHNNENKNNYSGKYAMCENIINVQLIRNNKHKAHQLNINLDFRNNQFSDKNLLIGALNGVSLANDEPISSEVFMVRSKDIYRGTEEEREELILRIKRYLNLNRKQYRAFQFRRLRNPKYFDEPDYNLSILENSIGTYYVYKLLEQENGKNVIWVSVFRLYEDYSADFLHAQYHKNRLLKCSISISHFEGRVAMNVRVLDAIKNNPISFSTLTVQNGLEVESYQKTGYIDNSTRQPMYGEITLKHHSPDPYYNGPSIKPGVFEEGSTEYVNFARLFKIFLENE